MKKISEEIYPFGSQHPKVSNITAVQRSLANRMRHRDLTPKEKALHKSMQIQSKLFTGRPAMKSTKVESKTEDRIYTMAFIKEAKNLSKEEKLDLLEFVYTEPDMKKVLEVVEKYVELDDGIWTRVVEATKQAKSLFYTKPAGKKMLKFAGKPPKAANKQLSKVVTGESSGEDFKLLALDFVVESDLTRDDKKHLISWIIEQEDVDLIKKAVVKAGVMSETMADWPIGGADARAAYRGVRSLFDKCLRDCGWRKGYFSSAKATSREVCRKNCQIKKLEGMISAAKKAGDAGQVSKLESKLSKAKVKLQKRQIELQKKAS